MRKVLAKLKMIFNTKSIFVYSILLVFGLVLFSIGANRITEKSGFCTNCHGMREFYDLRKNSKHYLSKKGDIQCVDCHLPVSFVERKKQKIYQGANDLFRTILPLKEPSYADPNQLNRKKYVFNEACLVCHKAGLEKSSLANPIIEIHRQIANKNLMNLDCVNCHGGMEHGKNPMFNWNLIQEFIKYGKRKSPKAMHLLADIVYKNCIGCHVQGNSSVSNFSPFYFYNGHSYYTEIGDNPENYPYRGIDPAYYLFVKMGIEIYDMPPQETLKKNCLNAFAQLSSIVENQ